MKEIKISVVIPAFNEAKNIESAITSIRQALALYEHEIIVVDNNSTDTTSKIAKSLGSVVLFNNVRNIAKTRNVGARQAKYPYLIFVDADSQINQGLVTKSVIAIKSKNVKAVSAITKYKSYPNLGSRGVWLYNVVSYFLRLGVGQYMFINKEVFTKLNGFNEEYFAYEELDFFRRLKKCYGRKSFKVVWEPVLSSARKFEDGKNSPLEFAYDLLKALINTNLGKDKSKLGFWYNNEN